MNNKWKSTLTCISRSHCLRLVLLISSVTSAADSGLGEIDGDGPALSVRTTQAEVINATSKEELLQIRKAGLRVFATPFNRQDGFGDGLADIGQDRAEQGNRPGIQSIDSPFLRLNGLDSQTCLECHSVLSTRQIPATFAPGGAGNFSDSAFANLTDFDIDDSEFPINGIAEVNGRVINPPATFGSGGVALLGKEMTKDLQVQFVQAQSNPGVVVALASKGVLFGSLLCSAVGVCDLSAVEGLDTTQSELADVFVVRPFGRTGCCISTRAFDVGAMQFHHGMQPVEVVGEDVDADNDGVVNEILIGELSALSLFLEGQRPPVQLDDISYAAEQGGDLFVSSGCADCHVPTMITDSKRLTFSFPEDETDPDANVYQSLKLNKHGFKKSGSGIAVNLFADLKLHDMGQSLAEANGNSLFTTAKLWGVADTAPYLHDGRALTLRKAILLHDGEGLAARDTFDNLGYSQQTAVIEYLKTLRNPKKPNKRLLK